MELLQQHNICETSSVVPWSRELFHDADEFWRKSDGLHHAYIIYRTLSGDYEDLFMPDAVFYVGKSPAAYLKKVQTKEISEEDVCQWQRFLWNQAVVPMLIIKSRTQIRVYTAYTKPEQQGSDERNSSILDTAADTLELDQLWTAIEAGTIIEEKPELFQRSHAVDRFLLDQLNAAAHQLAETQKHGVNKENLKFVHQFLTRLLFVCYLIERGMVKGEHFEAEELKKIHPAKKGTGGYLLRHLFHELNTYSQKRDALCRIFSRVKQRFNGSLFPEGVTEEKNRYNDDFMKILERFLHGHDLENSQLTLDFWAYDFRVIPIETISAVYERFLGAQGDIEESQGKLDSKRASGAYYTPLHLAELTVDIALENSGKPFHDLNVFDPACGSGVFLVSLFGRMAESLRRVEKHTGKSRSIGWARKLLPLLQQLYGIDINETACHITCFSLYLALLEQLTPMDVEYLHKHDEKLPPLLATDFTKGNNTIHCGNLFDPQLALHKYDFDLVIGNPPWVSRAKQNDEYFLSWRKDNPNVLGPEKQIAHGFMWKTREYISLRGSACFLLPTTVLLNNHTNKFQEQWFKDVTVERVVNFSDLRFVLFAGADHPCIAVRFRPLPSSPDDVVIYESPKTDIRSQRGGPVYVREEDITNLRLKDILKGATEGNAPIVWKTHYWGSWRDQRLIGRLLDLPKLSDLAGKPDEGKRWIKGQGIQINGSDPNQGWWHSSMRYLDSKVDADLLIPNYLLQTVEEVNIPKIVHRPRDKRLFYGPKVLFAKASRRVMFCPFAVLFRDTYTAITGNDEDENLLRFLTAVLGSDLIYYFLWHTNSNLGIYRPQIFPKEYLSIPFFLPEDTYEPTKAKHIIEKAAGVIKDFENKLSINDGFALHQESKRIRREVLEPLVREYYDIDKYESMLLDDTNQLAIKSFHPNQSRPHIPTLRTVDEEQSKEYAQTLCEMLNNFGRGSNFKVNGDVIKGHPYSVVKVSLVEKVRRKVSISAANKELVDSFKRIKSFLQDKQGRFVFCQNLKVFDGDDLYILKPMQMRFWSQTAALNDADEIAGAIIKSRGGLNGS